jgi:small subunit ribosomal protein S18
MKKKTRTPRRAKRQDSAEVGRAPKRLEGVENIDHKDAELLRRFMTERGKIMPRRTTYASAKQQRQIRKAIRRARVMGMLP